LIVCGKFFFVCATKWSTDIAKSYPMEWACCLELSGSWVRYERFSFSFSRRRLEDSASGTRTEVPKLAFAFKRTCLLRISRCGCWAADTTKQNKNERHLAHERVKVSEGV
jgi:hypothetical protein